MEVNSINLNIDGYEIISKIGEGANGICYCAKKDGQFYVIKHYIVNAEDELASAKEKCDKEYEILSRLYFSEDNGSSYFFAANSYVDDKNVCLIMTTSSGSTLKEYAKCTLAEILKLMENAVYSIEQVHKCNLLHFDLKVENLYVKEDHTKFIIPIDLGSAFELKERSVEELKNMNFSYTQRYCSNLAHQFMSSLKRLNIYSSDGEKQRVQELAGELSHKEDIYSLIHCLFYLITGKDYVEILEEYVCEPYDALHNEIEQVTVKSEETEGRGQKVVPDYMVDYFADFFYKIFENGSSEPYEYLNNPAEPEKSLLAKIYEMKDILECKGFHPEIMRKKAKEYFENELYQFIDPEKGFDERLLCDIEEYQGE